MKRPAGQEDLRPPGFAYRAGVLHCEGKDLRALADAYGTPLYVYFATTIRDRTRTLDAAFAGFPHTLWYAVKANSNLSLLRLFAQLGCGVVFVFGGDLERVLRAAPSACKKGGVSGAG